jgi:DNA-binding transcriptional regulator YhcF (GntR family)
MKFIKVSEDNAFPKYQQIINSVEKSIANQLLKKMINFRLLTRYV